MNDQTSVYTDFKQIYPLSIKFWIVILLIYLPYNQVMAQVSPSGKPVSYPLPGGKVLPPGRG
ncbi:hypothetical protein G8759_15150 [Spirosoma aureum]|uniref:Uncharacterized protein n=1 Tax=Spirosoma aureum TaxID=2692134 RepID=A0A6G9AMY1_9BACT|nr:hypothetical protein [Spirosoma aureum]QIP13852.1 hypothetical protein G8759_15150 [Spirosoma aureum]